jgi:hypothetical protein
MRVNGCQVKNKEKVQISFQMETLIMESTLIIYHMGKEFISGLVVVFMRVNLKRV